MKMCYNLGFAWQGHGNLSRHVAVLDCRKLESVSGYSEMYIETIQSMSPTVHQLKTVTYTGTMTSYYNEQEGPDGPSSLT
ncbi:hypothetical protein DPMN_145209 [Dreissena polymorpha]|uniref:Uncharacterized protein n=1 Tax=Dreissena polymorpha TaxID=45954 RepID=A0A9D4IYL0_DREPO|nr:hypothetical protein DPMN_145209 [Dreissena polymorpha]